MTVPAHETIRQIRTRIFMMVRRAMADILTAAEFSTFALFANGKKVEKRDLLELTASAFMALPETQDDYSHPETTSSEGSDAGRNSS